MTIRELAEKLKTEYGMETEKRKKAESTGILLEYWYNYIQTHTDGSKHHTIINRIRTYDNYIFGTLIGLHGACFITDSEFESLTKEMREKQREYLKNII